MLATIATKSETTGEPTVLPSVVTPIDHLMTDDPALKIGELIATAPSSAADTRMKVDNRDPAEPDSNEGTEGDIKQVKVDSEL